MPYYCKVFLLCMCGLPMLDALLEAVIWIRGKVSMTFPLYLLRVTWSAFMIWIFFAAILAGVSIIQLYRVTYKGYEELEYRFADEIESSSDIAEYEVVDGSDDDPEMVLYARPAKVTAFERYSRYIKISAVGTVVLGVLYAAVKLLV